QRLRDDPREGEVAGAAALAASAEGVDPPHDLRVEADAAVEPEPPSVRAADRDAARPARRERLPEPARGRDRVARQPEQPRHHARPAPGHEPERHTAVGAVQRLVEAAVAAAPDPDATAAFYERVFGARAPQAVPSSES